MFESGDGCYFHDLFQLEPMEMFVAEEHLEDSDEFLTDLFLYVVRERDVFWDEDPHTRYRIEFDGRVIGEGEYGHC